MGTGWSQDETPQATHPYRTTSDNFNPTQRATEVKQLPLNYDESQTSKATATRTIGAQEQPHNYEKEPKKTMRQSSKIISESSESKIVAKLPHHYEDIIKDADEPIDRSKLYEQLQAGVFLNQRRQKYWVDKSNSNCFMLYARDLSITWGEEPKYWQWPILKEASGSLISIAELINVCWLEVHGKIRIEKLSPGITYKVVFVVSMKDPAYGWEVPVKLRLVLPNGNTQVSEERLSEKPKGQWIEVPVGELRTSGHEKEDVQFSLFEYKGGNWKRGILIKGLLIRPKK